MRYLLLIIVCFLMVGPALSGDVCNDKTCAKDVKHVFDIEDPDTPSVVIEARKSVFMLQGWVFDKKNERYFVFGEAWCIKDNDLIITAAHYLSLQGEPGEIDSKMVKNKNNIFRVFKNLYSEPLPAEVIAVSEKNDLAVLRVFPMINKPADSITVESGSMAMPLVVKEFSAIALPISGRDLLLEERVFSLEVELLGSVEMRIASRKVRRVVKKEFLNQFTGRTEILITTGPSNPSASGAPLLDEKGEVVGLLFAHTPNTRYGLFIPAKKILEFLYDKEIYKKK